jgi:hypothetical protein
VAVSQDVRSLFELRPSPPRWAIAAQAAVAIGLPTVGFAIVGRADLGLLASSGGFVALYLSNRSRRERAAILPILALGLIAASAVGVASSGSVVLSMVALFGVAAVSSALCFGFAVGPPGGLFFLLLCGVSSRLAAPVDLNGEAIPGGLVIGMVAVGCLLAYLVVLTPLLVPRVRHRDYRLHRQRTLIRFGLGGVDRIILERVVIASAIAALLAAPLGIHRAYWVVLTVVVILQNGHRLRLTALRAVHRVLGTFVGLALFAFILWLNPQGIWLGLVIMALQFSVELIVIRNYGLALILITPLALIIAAQAGAGTVRATVADRVIDTLLGAGVALVVLLGSYIAGRVSRRQLF